VLGGGDTAMEEATFLTTFASHVTIIHRRDEFRASPIMLEKAKKNPKISFLTNKAVDSFYGDTVLKGIKLIDTKTNKTEDFPVGGVFVAIGHTPATGFLKGFIDLDEKGYVMTGNIKYQSSNFKSSSKEEVQRVSIPFNEIVHTQTSVNGVFAAGDCVDHVYRQAIVAAGMGAQAALDAQKYLEDTK
jgi:thioredoxin reductase (NADPH)